MAHTCRNRLHTWRQKIRRHMHPACRRTCRRHQQAALDGRQGVLCHVSLRTRQPDCKSPCRNSRRSPVNPMGRSPRRPRPHNNRKQPHNPVRHRHILSPDCRPATLSQQFVVAMGGSLLDTGQRKGRQQRRGYAGNRLDFPPRRPVCHKQGKLCARQRRHRHRGQLLQHAVVPFGQPGCDHENIVRHKL